jgi:PUA domain protein
MSRITLKKRHIIRKSQAQELLIRLREEIGESASLFLSERMEIVETDSDMVFFLVGKKPLLMERQEVIFPTIRGILEHPFPERMVTVDSGAVAFVVNGADVMRPGIVSLTPDIRAGRPVQVVEERHGKPLAVGIALFDAPEIREKKEGKVVRTYHHVGDDIWNVDL